MRYFYKYRFGQNQPEWVINQYGQSLKEVFFSEELYQNFNNNVL